MNEMDQVGPRSGEESPPSACFRVSLPHEVPVEAVKGQKTTVSDP